MTENIRLRHCDEADAARLALVGAATFLETFAGTLQGDDILAHCAQKNSEKQYRTWLASPGHSLCVAEIERAPVGYAVLCPPELPVATNDSDIELRRIYLLYRFQKSGLGSALMAWAIDEARRLGKIRLLLGVYAGNQVAIRFYERHGFVPAGTRTFQVGQQMCDDLIMACPLSK